MKISSLFILCLCIMACPNGNNTGLSTIYWNPVTTYDNGTPADVKGYKIKCENSINESNIIDTGRSDTTYPLSSLIKNPGTYKCAVLAYNETNESSSYSEYVTIKYDGSRFTKP